MNLFWFALFFLHMLYIVHVSANAKRFCLARGACACDAISSLSVTFLLRSRYVDALLLFSVVLIMYLWCTAWSRWTRPRFSKCWIVWKFWPGLTRPFWNLQNFLFVERAFHLWGVLKDTPSVSFNLKNLLQEISARERHSIFIDPSPFLEIVSSSSSSLPIVTNQTLSMSQAIISCIRLAPGFVIASACFKWNLLSGCWTSGRMSYPIVSWSSVGEFRVPSSKCSF